MGIRGATGGHAAPYLVRDDGVHRLPKTPGMVLGMIEDASYGQESAVLKAGDGVFLFTDGITEAMDACGVAFSDRRLEAVLQDAGSAGPDAVIRRVVAAVKQHAGEAPQSDDVTVLAFKYLGV